LRAVLVPVVLLLVAALIAGAVALIARVTKQKPSLYLSQSCS
jgi:hypothetical protein